MSAANDNLPVTEKVGVAIRMASYRCPGRSSCDLSKDAPSIVSILEQARSRLTVLEAVYEAARTCSKEFVTMLDYPEGKTLRAAVNAAADGTGVEPSELHRIYATLTEVIAMLDHTDEDGAHPGVGAAIEELRALRPATKGAVA
jgi:hypothetical protein